MQSNLLDNLQKELNFNLNFDIKTLKQVDIETLYQIYEKQNILALIYQEKAIETVKSLQKKANLLEEQISNISKKKSTVPSASNKLDYPKILRRLDALSEKIDSITLLKKSNIIKALKA